MHEYWERFKELCSSYPYYQTNDQSLVRRFYSGLTPLERNYVDVAAGGALSDKTPTEARAFIARMRENTQTFGSRTESSNSSSSEISGLKNQMSYLVSMVRDVN